MDAQALSATLQRLGISQAEAARLLGVTKGAVSMWASGKRPIPAPVAKLLGACVDVRGVMELLTHGR